ncbi:5-methyltetrahydropteroyltriglutamate--homocysteine methyltransferase [Bradyrhizobium sp. IAR9]|uniref:hypothetical protein n=1 Tax=Bradyrhizobium sp. IAR9 TaxID=2663841 RepID=UPI0015C8187B|nr:hypothetical protein [Bradyrhizobium sp. IAR9]NYG45481.1 5-methyltetrahydropteroyltriglutamate--homocysteine methyltransferase [Bradyrhizobium sp. IAR9]
MSLHPLTTQIVGSYTKPHWLARHQRMRALDGSWWRPEQEVLAEAKRDAALLSIYEQEKAGLDLITDGEAQRAAYDRHFLTSLSGIDTTTPVLKVASSIEISSKRSDSPEIEEYLSYSRLKPRVISEIKWTGSVAVDELHFAKLHTIRPVKVTVVGPLTLANQVSDHFYNDEETLLLEFARALNLEMKALQAAGADLLQVDEPHFHARLSTARKHGKKALEVLVEGISVPVTTHVCYGYALVHQEKSKSPTYPEVLEILSECPTTAISLEYEQPKHDPALLRYCGQKHVVLGLLDLARKDIETPEHIARRISDALEIVPPERLHPSSDCGMWFLPRAFAFGKIRSLVDGTRIVKASL